MNTFDKSTNACFAGYSPQHLPQQEVLIEYIKKTIELAIIKALLNGCTHFITDCKPGINLWAAEKLLELRDIDRIKKNYPCLTLECILPRKSERSINPLYHYRLHKVIERAEFINKDFEKRDAKKRAQYLVDSSCLLITYWDDEKPDALNYINHYAAQTEGIHIANIYGKLEILFENGDNPFEWARIFIESL
ncbi:MAG: SLOG family protein [Candidatus Fimivicinus sp.]|nr:DUF1273 domain-containing protein [Oscillospiraceae bacterium]MDY5590036.1 SLOG family protein [Candidatus Fimivicinus sp.]